MGTTALLRCGTTVAALLLLAAVNAGDAQGFEKACSFCHEVHGMDGPVRLLDQPPGLCLGCHPERTAPKEHRIEIPAKTKHKELPLNNGLMGCLTCHDPHSRGRGMLRLPQEKLCLSCHEK